MAKKIIDKTNLNYNEDKLSTNDSPGFPVSTEFRVKRNRQQVVESNPLNPNIIENRNWPYTCEHVTADDWTPLGDVNNDGAYNIIDIVQIVNMALSDNDDPCADMNGDGTVNILDILVLVNCVMFNTYPCVSPSIDEEVHRPEYEALCTDPTALNYSPGLSDNTSTSTDNFRDCIYPGVTIATDTSTDKILRLPRGSYILTFDSMWTYTPTSDVFASLYRYRHDWEINGGDYLIKDYRGQKVEFDDEVLIMNGTECFPEEESHGSAQSSKCYESPTINHVEGVGGAWYHLLVYKEIIWTAPFYSRVFKCELDLPPIPGSV